MEHCSLVLESFQLVGIARRVSNDRPESIGALWKEFFAGGGVEQIPNRRGDDLYALYTDYESDHTGSFTLLIGCAVDRDVSPSEGLEARVVRAARYLVFDATGPQPESVVATWKRIWGTALRRSFTADFDRYGSDQRVLVHVAVE